ncbi:D-aminoacyl-tRNA deacylase [Schistosoma japonicum]|nr:D-aminoacyl-tRNA deacylase [Schistosoma japonicum]
MSGLEELLTFLRVNRKLEDNNPKFDVNVQFITCLVNKCKSLDPKLAFFKNDVELSTFLTSLAECLRACYSYFSTNINEPTDEYESREADEPKPGNETLSSTVNSLFTIQCVIRLIFHVQHLVVIIIKQFKCEIRNYARETFKNKDELFEGDSKSLFGSILKCIVHSLRHYYDKCSVSYLEGVKSNGASAENSIQMLNLLSRIFTFCIREFTKEIFTSDINSLAIVTFMDWLSWIIEVSYFGGLYPLGLNFPAKIAEEMNNSFFLSIDIILSHMITLHPPYESREDCSSFVQAISHSDFVAPVICRIYSKILGNIAQHPCFYSLWMNDSFNIYKELFEACEKIDLSLSGENNTMDVWCFVARYGTGDLCLHYVTILTNILNKVTERLKMENCINKSKSLSLTNIVSRLSHLLSRLIVFLTPKQQSVYVHQNPLKFVNTNPNIDPINSQSNSIVWYYVPIPISRLQKASTGIIEQQVIERLLNLDKLFDLTTTIVNSPQSYYLLLEVCLGLRLSGCLSELHKNSCARILVKCIHFLLKCNMSLITVEQCSHSYASTSLQSWTLQPISVVFVCLSSWFPKLHATSLNNRNLQQIAELLKDLVKLSFHADSTCVLSIYSFSIYNTWNSWLDCSVTQGYLQIWIEQLKNSINQCELQGKPDQFGDDILESLRKKIDSICPSKQHTVYLPQLNQSSSNNCLNDNSSSNNHIHNDNEDDIDTIITMCLRDISSAVNRLQTVWPPKGPNKTIQFNEAINILKNLSNFVYYSLYTMRAVVQRVKQASVSVNDSIVSQISRGILVLIGLSRRDTEKDMEYIVRKILNIRLFPSADGARRWDKSVKDLNLEILCVSQQKQFTFQFTLYSELKGNKLDFHCAMDPKLSKDTYSLLINQLKRNYHEEKVKDGIFGAMMDVSLINDGPVTITLDSNPDISRHVTVDSHDTETSNKQ